MKAQGNYKSKSIWRDSSSIWQLACSNNCSIFFQNSVELASEVIVFEHPQLQNKYLVSEYKSKLFKLPTARELYQSNYEKASKPENTDFGKKKGRDKTVSSSKDKRGRVSRQFEPWEHICQFNSILHLLSFQAAGTKASTTILFTEASFIPGTKWNQNRCVDRSLQLSVSDRNNFFFKMEPQSLDFREMFVECTPLSRQTLTCKRECPGRPMLLWLTNQALTVLITKTGWFFRFTPTSFPDNAVLIWYSWIKQVHWEQIQEIYATCSISVTLTNTDSLVDQTLGRLLRAQLIPDLPDPVSTFTSAISSFSKNGAGWLLQGLHPWHLIPLHFLSDSSFSTNPQIVSRQSVSSTNTLRPADPHSLHDFPLTAPPHPLDPTRGISIPVASYCIWSWAKSLCCTATPHC